MKIPLVYAKLSHNGTFFWVPKYSRLQVKLKRKVNKSGLIENNQQIFLLWITRTFITGESNVVFEFHFEILAKEKSSDFDSLIRYHRRIKWPCLRIVMTKSVLKSIGINRLIEPVTERKNQMSLFISTN